MTEPTGTIEHEEDGPRGGFVYKVDGRRLGEMTYSRVNDHLVIIDHTEVDPSLSGQGIGRRLLHAAVAWAREHGTKFMATCPFALAQFKRDASLKDVVA